MNDLNSKEKIDLYSQFAELFGDVADIFAQNNAAPWENLEPVDARAGVLNVAQGAAQGAAIGTAVAPGAGTAVGAAVGAVVNPLLSGLQRKAQKERIRAAQDLRAKQLINTISDRARVVSNARTQVERAFNSAVFLNAERRLLKNVGAKYGYLSQQPGGVSLALQKRALSSAKTRGEAVIEGAKVALSEKADNLSVALGLIQETKSEIWKNRRSGKFDTSGLATVQEVLRALNE